jgi:hypothetical protein
MTNNPIAIFRISPIIRITLISLYIALTLPLPFLSQVVNAAVSPELLWLGIGIGLIILYAVLTERVLTDDQGIKVTYPSWVNVFLKKGWYLDWSDIKSLKMRTTGQGGLIYYFITNSDQGYLLPMRIVGFNKLVKIVQEKTGIDTTDIRPLAQPWMYIILLICTMFLLLIDLWVILQT